MSDTGAIVALLHAYCDALDRGVLDEVIGLFHPEAVLWPAYAGDQRYEGHDALRAYYRGHAEATERTLRHVRHRISTPVVDVVGESASSRCYFDADFLDRESGLPGAVAGRYEDELTYTAGRWLFRRRTTLVHYAFTHAIRGDVTEFA